MEERELSRLAVLSEALVWNPIVYPRLIRNMRESGRLVEGSSLAQAVSFLEQRLDSLNLREATNQDEAREQLRNLVPRLVDSPAHSPQWHLGQMLAGAFEALELSTNGPVRAIG